MTSHLQSPSEEQVDRANTTSNQGEVEDDISLSLRIYLLALVAQHQALGLSREQAQHAALRECGCSAPFLSIASRTPPTPPSTG